MQSIVAECRALTVLTLNGCPGLRDQAVLLDRHGGVALRQLEILEVARSYQSALLQSKGAMPDIYREFRGCRVRIACAEMSYCDVATKNRSWFIYEAL